MSRRTGGAAMNLLLVAGARPNFITPMSWRS